MKGIILAGGAGTRLHPLTISVSKQLMPIYDKPMIYYPLSTLMLAGIREILIITTIYEQGAFQNLLGDGSQLGCKFEYAHQEEPNGLAEAFIIGEEFIGNDDVALILGDNIFHGSGLSQILQDSKSDIKGGVIFAYKVKDPRRFGVVQFNVSGEVLSLEEKPKNPKSPYAIPGLYFYNNSVVEIAKNLEPSDRGELEITDINKIYLERNQLLARILPRGSSWLDTGTFDSLNEANNFIKATQSNSNVKIGSIEEVAWRMGYIGSQQLHDLSLLLNKSGYGEYLREIIREG